MARRRSSNSQDGNRDAQSGTTSTDVNARPRVAEALRLRRLGHTYEEIASRCGYANESGARKAIKKANASIIRDDARALVGWQLDQIDAALTVVMERIQRRDKESLWAVDRLAPLLKRQAELMGLDAKQGEETPQVVIRAYPQAWIGEPTS